MRARFYVPVLLCAGYARQETISLPATDLTVGNIKAFTVGSKVLADVGIVSSNNLRVIESMHPCSQPSTLLGAKAVPQDGQLFLALNTTFISWALISCRTLKAPSSSLRVPRR